MSQDVLIVFTRFPVPGKTKTRLIPALGPQGAADLQRAMTEHTLQQVAGLAARDYDVSIRYDGAEETQMRTWLGNEQRLLPQSGGDLGQRLCDAFTHEFDAGAAHCAAIGIDCPEVSARHVSQAFAFLGDHEAVIGPATDGGYYLIAISAAAAAPAMRAAFEDIDWGTETVGAETRARLTTAGLRLAELEPLNDVDRVEDLVVWERARKA